MPRKHHQPPAGHYLIIYIRYVTGFRSYWTAFCFTIHVSSGWFAGEQGCASDCNHRASEELPSQIETHIYRAVLLLEVSLMPVRKVSTLYQEAARFSVKTLFGYEARTL